MVSLRFGQARWNAEPSVVEEFFDEWGLKLDEWQRTGQAEIIKTGPHRSVYRLRLPSGRFILKHYRIPGLHAQLQNMIRPCKAVLEWNAIRRVRKLGIPTIRAVAVGRTMVGAVVRDSYLITCEIDDVETLHDFVLHSIDRFGDRERALLRQRIANRLGQLAARLHHGKLIHRDLHAGNILVRIEGGNEVRLWLIDLHAVGIARALTLRRIERNLSLLNHFFAHFSTASDRLRFFHSYWKTLHQPPKSESAKLPIRPSAAFPQVARRFEAYCRKAVLHAFRKGDRKWVRGNRRLIIADSQDTQCRGIADLGQSWITAIRDDPEQLFAADRVKFWYRRSAEHRMAAVDVESNGVTRECVATAIETDRPVGWLRKFFWRSAARRAWEAGHALLRRSLGTGRPLLFVETNSGKRERHYLLTERIPDTTPLSTYLQSELDDLPEALRESWLANCVHRLAAQVRWMHECRVDHQALTADRILVSGNSLPCRFWFLGLADVRLRSWLPKSRIVRGLAQLNASLPSSRSVRNTHRLRFLRRYLGSCFATDWKHFWRSIARRSTGGGGGSNSCDRQLCGGGGLDRRAALSLLAGLVLAGCRGSQNAISLPARYSVRSEQLLVLSDFLLPKDHPLIQDLTRLRRQVAESLELPLQDETVVVYLFSNELEYSQFLNATYPGLPLRRAYFFSTQRELAVYTFWGERIQEDLRHEYTHGLLHASLKKVPLWIDEGLAEYFEVAGPQPGRINHNYANRLSAALANGWRPDLKRLEQIEDFPKMQRVDYQEAWAWVHFMLHSTPEAKQALLAYLDDLRDGKQPVALSTRLKEVHPQFATRFRNDLASLHTTGAWMRSL
jgi:tRNA A-37 threonylcarbamoyl transferase component Bud32